MDLLAVLFVLGLCSSLAVGNDLKSGAPEDLDGSGDDEEISGSGFGVDLESKTADAYVTSVSPLFSTQVSTVQQPDVAGEVKTVANTTEQTLTTRPHDVIDIDKVVNELMMEKVTTLVPTTHPTSTAELIGVDHHHHHTTTWSTSGSAMEGHDEDVTVKTSESDQQPAFPEEHSTSTHPAEPDSHLEVTTDLSTPHNVEETTSGSSSTPVMGNEGIVVPLDRDEFPIFHSGTTVADSSTHKDEHPHEQTTSSFAEADVYRQTTRKPSEEGPVLPHEPSATPTGEDKHHRHHHHHHHSTTSSTSQPSDVEIPHTDHNQESVKGRKAHVPFHSTTTAIPVLNEDEHIPEERDHPELPTPSSSSYKTSALPIPDENEDLPDSKEEMGSGEDLFFEATVPNVKAEDKVESSDKSSPGSSHGIMERKELLAGIIAGGVAGLVFAAFLVAFVFYRMKKKDEGSYSLEEPKQSNGGYQKPREQREFYA